MSSHGNTSRIGTTATARRLATVAICALVAATQPVAGAEDERPWEISPYQVRVALAVDLVARPDGSLEAEISRAIRQRTDAALRPRWQMELQPAAPGPARRQCFAPLEKTWDELDPAERAADKQLWLGVAAKSTGYVLTCREFDAYTRRWGPTIRRQVSQRTYLPEACFRILTDAFSPLARIEPPADDGATPLVFKGGALPRPDGADLLVSAGDIFVPVFRRTDRGGDLAKGGITPVPWTYLVAGEPSAAGWTAQLKTALRSPLSGRRRGSIEQLAVGLGPTMDPIRVRFFARSNAEQALSGYEVFRVVDEAQPPQRVGLTDRDGVITVPPEGDPVATLILRSDGQVLAKLLVAPGTAATIDAPIADDAVRLAAQGEMQAVREELIDVVARRAILVARVQNALKAGDVAAARELMAQVNDLPTSSNFARRIERLQQRLPVSDDPQVRRTVEELFKSTSELLARFLDARTIVDLQAEVNMASPGGS